MKKEHLSIYQYQAKKAKSERIMKIIENPKVFSYLAFLFVFITEIYLLFIANNGKPVDGGLITAIIIIAAFPVLIMRAYDISVLSLNKDGLKMEIEDMPDNTEGQNSISRLYAQALSDSLYSILSALHDKIDEQQELNDKLRNQLLFLEYKGYIKPLNNLEDQNTTTSICSLFEITDLGKDFMKFRQDVLSN